MGLVGADDAAPHAEEDIGLTQEVGGVDRHFGAQERVDKPEPSKEPACSVVALQTRQRRERRGKLVAFIGAENTDDVLGE